MSTLARHDPLSPTAVGLAILLHIGVVIVLVVMGHLHRLPEPPPPKVIQTYIAPAPASAPPAPALPATAPEPPAPAPKMAPPPETVAPKPLPQPAKPAPVSKPVTAPKPAPVAKPTLPAKPVESIAPAPVAPPKPKPFTPLANPDQEAMEIEAQAATAAAEAERIRRQQQAALAYAAEKQAAEQQARTARASQAAGLIARYTGLIRDRLKRFWTPPSCAVEGMSVELRLSMLPDGDVANVATTRSSGCTAFDRSAEQAVRLAAPLPVPADPVVFNDNFRSFKLMFKPEL